jgi:hypothetical protein
VRVYCMRRHELRQSLNMESGFIKKKWIWVVILIITFLCGPAYSEYDIHSNFITEDKRDRVASSRTPRPTTEPSRQLTSKPSRLLIALPASIMPTNNESSPPTPAPTMVPSDNEAVNASTVPWFFKSHAVNLNLLGVFCVFIVIDVVSLIYEYSCPTKKLHKLRTAVNMFNFLFFLMNSLIVLSSRFQFFLDHKRDYQLMKTCDDKYIWSGPKYYEANIDVLVGANCPYCADSTGSISELSIVKRECNFLGVSLDAELIRSGAAQFSLGFGLLALLIVQLSVLFITELRTPSTMQDSESDLDFGSVRSEITFLDYAYHAFQLSVSPTLDKLTSCKWCKYPVVIFIQAQQFCVLMLLTNWRADDYCAQLVIPSSDEMQAVCYYVYSVYSVPYGIIFASAAVLSGVGARCVYMNKFKLSANVTGALSLLLSGIFFFCTFFALALAAYYFLVGFAIGLWFEFGSLTFTWDLVYFECCGIVPFVVVDAGQRLLAQREASPAAGIDAHKVVPYTTADLEA